MLCCGAADESLPLLASGPRKGSGACGLRPRRSLNSLWAEAAWALLYAADIKSLHMCSLVPPARDVVLLESPPPPAATTNGVSLSRVDWTPSQCSACSGWVGEWGQPGEA